MLEVFLGGLGALCMIWIAYLTREISVLRDSMIVGEQNLSSLAENVDEIQGVIVEKFESIQESQSFDWREMIEMQRANLFQNILGIGVQKVANKFGLGQIALANVDNGPALGGEAWHEEERNAADVETATI